MIFFCDIINNNAYFRRIKVKIIKMSVVDRAELKKPHPCGGNIFKRLRVGSEIRIVCENCGRDMTLDRVKFEKAIKKIIYNENRGSADE